MTIRQRRRREGQRGFILLLVFMMAAAVGLMLYMQTPREAFESERDKEQMLIDRGEQFKRAIYVYYVSNNRTWPSKIEDLENTNNHRYLRHRYIDPYTGKDEWRLIHTNGAFLTDSLVTPPPNQANPNGQQGPLAGGQLAGTGPPTGNNNLGTFGTPTPDPNAPPEINAQVRQRPSDRQYVQNSTFQAPSGGNAPPNNDPGYQPFNPNTPISLFPNGYGAAPVNTPGTNLIGTQQPGLPGQPAQPGQPGFNQIGFNQPGVVQPGQAGLPGIPGQPVIGQPGFNQPGFNQTGFNQPGFNSPTGQPAGVPGFTIPGTNSTGNNPGIVPPNLNPSNVGQPGFNQGFNQPIQQPNITEQGGFGVPPPPGVSGATPPPPANQAVNLINQLLTTPRAPPPGLGANPAQGGGGLAGIASTYKGATIKTYADRKKYQEWEFVFQLSQLTTLQPPAGAGPNGAGQPGAAGQPGNGFGTGTGPAPGGAPGIAGPLGNQSGFAPFGQQPIGGAPGGAQPTQPPGNPSPFGINP